MIFYNGTNYMAKIYLQHTSNEDINGVSLHLPIYLAGKTKYENCTQQDI